MRAGSTPWLTPVVGGLLGAVLFLATLGPAIVRPTNLGWVMRHDTQTYLLAWHHFRREPWQWPPGKVVGVGYPVGTSVGNSDAIPLVALPLKPFHAWLPDPAQYLGAWLLVCFVLQGVFGALLTRQVTAGAWLQVLGAGLFVQTPALLHRGGHTALCAHWMLLAAIWLASARVGRVPRRHFAAWLALCAAVTATQPYLAALVIGLAVADVAADAWAARHDGSPWRRAARAGAAVVAVIAVAAGTGWLTGLFLVGSSDFGLGGLGHYSMNLLSPLIPFGYSSLLPELPMATQGQYEGLIYFGAGWLSLTLLAITRGRRIVWPPLRLGWLVVAGAMLYALSPVVTVGPYVVADLSAWAPAVLSVFRSSGRFGWLPMYVVFVTAIATAAATLPRRMVLGAVAAALALQTVDLSGAYGRVHERGRDPQWIDWRDPLQHPVWDIAVPHYRHLVMVRPDMCAGPGPEVAGEHLPFSLRTGTHGVTVNSGFAGRYDFSGVRGYCAALDADLRAGRVSDDSLYVIAPRLLDGLRGSTRTPLVCGEADGFQICVTAASYARWRTDGERAGFTPAAP